jgi:hypothetical protein
MICQHVIDHSLDFVDRSQKREADSLDKKTRLKESKLIPELIFQTEQFDLLVIKYSKVHSVDFDQYLKRRKARDFRLRTEVG